MLPLFISNYWVPLVTIAEATTRPDRKILFFKNNRDANVPPYFATDWVYNVGAGQIKAEYVYPNVTSPKDLTSVQLARLDYNFTTFDAHPKMNVMGEEHKPLRKVYIAQEIDPVELQKDPQNFGYVIV